MSAIHFVFISVQRHSLDCLQVFFFVYTLVKMFAVIFVLPLIKVLLSKGVPITPQIAGSWCSCKTQKGVGITLTKGSCYTLIGVTN